VALGLRFAADSRILVSGQPARVLEVRNDRIEALMPERAPLGEATLVITNADGESRPFRMRVAHSSPGLYAQPLSTSPGAEAAIMVTGLAPHAPLQLWVGAVKANVRTIRPAEDGKYRIRFETPRNAPLGCFVPVHARDAESHVSNFILISVHRPDVPCEDGSAWPLAAMPAGGTGARVGLARVRVSMSTGSKPVLNVGDLGFTAFVPADPVEPPFSGRLLRPAPGTCQAVSDLSQPGALSTLPSLLFAMGKTRALSAGPAIQVEGPRGHALLLPVPDQAGLYSNALGGELPMIRSDRALPLFLGPEETIVSAPGDQIGSFSLRLPGLPRLEWPAFDRIQTVDRARGLFLEWSSSTRVLFALLNVDQRTTAMTAAMCQPPAGARSFRVSPDILANFPASTPDRPLPVGWVALVTLQKGVQFRAEGLDVGYGMTLQAMLRAVRFR
jgi:hypothetical protein